MAGSPGNSRLLLGRDRITGVAVLSEAAELERAGTPFVMVTLVETAGSTPSNAGAKMIATTAGRHAGTVGGGRVEAAALKTAQELLNDTALPSPVIHKWNLKRDIGMTCGGTVTLLFERFSPPRWRIVIFGAGHVAQSLAALLATLRCHVVCFDGRSDWIQRLPAARNIEPILRTDLADAAAEVKPEDFVVIMTQGHATDLPVLAALLKRERLPAFVGVIGSRAKRAVLQRELAEHGVPEERLGDFHCPVGLPLGDNSPPEIAVSIVAQLLQVRDA